MTQDNVMRLSGRELDEAVAALVFGLRVVECDPLDGRYGPYNVREGHWTRVNGETYPLLDLLPEYSSDIAAAWEVVEHLGRTWDVHLSRHFSGEYTCTFDRFDNGNYRHTTAKADTAPLAICRAALLAVARHSLAKTGGGEA